MRRCAVVVTLAVELGLSAIAHGCAIGLLERPVSESASYVTVAGAKGGATAAGGRSC